MELQRPYKVYSADSGTIRFGVICQRIQEYQDRRENVQVILSAKECAHEDLVTMSFNFRQMDFIVKFKGIEQQNKLPFEVNPVSAEYWLSWYNNRLRIGLMGQPPFKEVQDIFDPSQLVGYIKLYVTRTIDVVIHSPSVNLKPLSLKHFVDGELHWVNHEIYQNRLPPNAFIGGFENGEFLYVALARHGYSDCPGKYVPSKNCAYVPWGHNEHKKKDYKILCGYNAMWVKCKGDLIPENAFAAGKSEVNNETLYIGRAMIGKDLIVGKIHMLYKTCYLPYDGKEVEKYTYEILVRRNVTEHAETANEKCCMDPMKSLQPCV